MANRNMIEDALVGLSGGGGGGTAGAAVRALRKNPRAGTREARVLRTRGALRVRGAGPMAPARGDRRQLSMARPRGARPAAPRGALRRTAKKVARRATGRGRRR